MKNPIVDELVRKVPGISGVCEKLDGSYHFVVKSSREKTKVDEAMKGHLYSIDVNYSDSEIEFFEKHSIKKK
jgi:hypothetical protein